MSEKIHFPVLSCELFNGYVFKNCFGFTSSIRGRPIITFLADRMVAPNRTSDDQIYGTNSLFGDEMNLNWNDRIPVEERSLSLILGSDKLKDMFGKIKKKDQVKIIIDQIRDKNSPGEFTGESSSDDFCIYVSCGSGGDGREGLRSIMAIRTKADDTLIRYPSPEGSSLIIIPIKPFKDMIESFSKCKKNSVKIKYYVNSFEEDGREVKGPPGIIMIAEAVGQTLPIIEKFGEVPDDTNWALTLNVDEATIVRPSSEKHVELELSSAPNEFLFHSEKIGIFAKLAAMHNEGNVRIYYEKGCHLRISYRYGAFGETEICLSNQHLIID